MSGALILGVVSLVCVTDLALAFYFLRQANRTERVVGAAPKAGAIDPDAARRFARVLFLATPALWLFIALLSFGIIPVGNIIPIKF